MLGDYGSEVKGLRAEYQFGGESTANNSRNDTAAELGNATPPRDVTVAPGNTYSDDDYNNNAYSPQEDGTPAADPAPNTPGVFDNSNNQPYFANEGDNNSPAAVYTAPAANTKPDKSGKLGTVKDVLGIGKKSTKGKTPEEKKQINLEQRWKNALAEEQRLNALENQVRVGEVATQQTNKAPNLPPRFLCIRPLVHHDIGSDIPPERQRTVKIAFYNWVAVCVLLVCNLGICVGVSFAKNHGKQMNLALNTVLSCVYLVGIPLSFIIWYWRIYSANTDRSPAQHVVAMCGLIVALAQSLFAFIGPTNYGFCGIIYATYIGKHRDKGVVAPVAVMLCLWLAEAGLVCFLIFKEFRYWRKDLAERRREHRARKEQISPP